METIPGQLPTMADAERNASEERRKQLLFALDRLKAKADDFQMRKSAANLNLNVKKQESLRKIFSNMKQAGVDPSSRESVSSYIARMRQNNPDTAKMFEESIEYYLTPEQDNNMNNENPNEALSQGTSGY